MNQEIEKLKNQISELECFDPFGFLLKEFRDKLAREEKKFKTQSIDYSVM